MALHNLHQLKLCNTRLVVEYAKDGQTTNEPGGRSEETFDKEQFFSQLAVISSKFRINHPISPLLRYNYPPASAPILRNIAKALANCPPLYTQVLHLMNKMNLPPPFINTDYDYELDDDEQHLPKRVFDCKVVELNRETSERKRSIIRERIQKASKRLKSESGQLSVPTSSTAQNDSRKVADYFDDYAGVRRLQISGKVKLKERAEATNEVLQVDSAQDSFGIFASQSVSHRSVGDRMKATDQAKTNGKEEQQQEDCLKQLGQEELNECPVFRDYSIGEPSCRLYVKNVHKQVTERRLASVFMRLLGLADSQLSVSLFKKGKMNGQAFVSLPSEQLARTAIERSNGLLLDKKPIVVCFARSMKAKD